MSGNLFIKFKFDLIRMKVDILKLKADDYTWQCNTPQEVKDELENCLKEINEALARDKDENTAGG
jgi:hypothetical protein